MEGIFSRSASTMNELSARATAALSRALNPIAADQPLLKQLAAIGLVTTAAVIVHLARQRQRNRGQHQDKLPPSPSGAWPLVGHLPLLARHAAAPDQLFSKLGTELGPVFLLRLGAQRMLVVQSDTLAREALVRHGKAYAGRLLTAPWAVLTDGGGDIAFAPYGDAWRGMRRAVHKILTPAAVDAMDATLEREADRLVHYLAQHRVVQVPTLFQRYTANVIFTKAVGITFDELDDPGLTRMLESVLDMFRVMAVGGGIDEYVPEAGWFWGSRLVRRAVLRTAKAKMDAVHRLRDEFHNGFLIRRLKALQSNLHQEPIEDRRKRDLCYAEELLIQAMEGTTADTRNQDDDGDDAPGLTLSLNQIKLIMADLLLAGMDTTAGTMIWLAVLLVNHPEVQTKAYQTLVKYCGIDPITGKVRTPTLSQVAHLTYIRAIVKETLRFVPIGPLGLPRATIEDTHIGGYFVPKGTQVVFHVDAIHKDMYPASQDGDDFDPERWMESDGGHHRSKGVEIPDGIHTFGLGRRQCPGMHLAHRELCLVTARLVAAFELRSGDPNKRTLSMEKQFGLTTLPKDGALVEFVPRQ